MTTQKKVFENLVSILKSYSTLYVIRDLEKAIKYLLNNRVRYAKCKDVDDILANLDKISRSVIERVLGKVYALAEGEYSPGAQRALLSVITNRDRDYAFQFAIKCAQAYAGAHPQPHELKMAIDEDGLWFEGLAWDYWGEHLDEAMKVARRGFWQMILYELGLGPKPKLPEPII